MTPRATQLDILIVADSSSTNETAFLQRRYEFLIEKHRNTNWDALLRHAEVPGSRSETSQRFGLCRGFTQLFSPADIFVSLHTRHSHSCSSITAVSASPYLLFNMAASLTTCDRLLSLSTALPSPPSLPPVPEEGAHCAPPSISPVIGRSGALGVDYVGLGSFPRSDYPDLLGRNRPLPLGPSPPPPPLPPLPFFFFFSLILSFGIARALRFFQIWSLTAWMTSVVSICVTTRAWCHRAFPQASGKLNFMSTNVS